MPRNHLTTFSKCESHVLVVPGGRSRDKAYEHTLRNETTDLVHQAWVAAGREL